MEFPQLYIYEVEARPMLAERQTGVWLTYRVVAADIDDATPPSIIEHAVGYFRCGVTLTVDPRPVKLDAFVVNAGPALVAEVGNRVATT